MNFNLTTSILRLFCIFSRLQDYFAFACPSNTNNTYHSYKWRAVHWHGSNHTNVSNKSSATVFLGYLRGNWRYLRFSLISAVDFYYIINKLIILVPDPY
jgi:hypothetical protein